MYFVDNGSAVPVMPQVKPVSSATPQFFTEGGNGTPPTYPGPDWFNIFQLELLNVLKEAQINPDKANHTQLVTAMKKLFLDASSNGSDIPDKAAFLSNLGLGDVLHAGKNLYEIAEKGAAHQASARDNLALNAIAAIVGGKNKLPYFADMNTAALADFTAFAKTLLSRTDASAVRGDLGLKSAALREVGVGENQIPDISSFANSPHQNGFMKLPGGLMLQWGLGIGVNGTASVTFNQAFVNRPFFVGFGYKQSTFPSAMQSIIINDEYFDNTAFSARTLMFDGTAIAASPNAFLWYALGV